MRTRQRALAASTTGTAERFRPYRITATVLSSWSIPANHVNGFAGEAGPTHHDLPGRHPRHHVMRPDPKASTSKVASFTVTSPLA